jgi:dipeptidyl aminopeptidase/acylaminoacyl peptidase
LATSAWTEGQVRIWDTASGKEMQRIPAHNSDSSINCMTWSGDGKVLATWSRKERLIRLWNADTGKQMRELSISADEVETLVFSPDSKVLAAKGNDFPRRWDTNLILLWDVDTGRLLHSLDMRNDRPPSSSNNPSLPVFSPDGRTLAVGCQKADASIYLWELATGRLRLKLNHGEDVTHLAFSPDGRLLAAANNNIAYRNYALRPESFGHTVPQPHVHLWDLAAGTEIQVLKGHQGAISSLAFSPDGKLLATGSDDTTVLLWDATRFKTKQLVEVQLRPEQLESLWTDLGDADAVKAYHAIRTLAAAPKTSLVFLKRHLKPIAPEDATQLARLIADLDSDQFTVREKAMQQLEKLGDRAAAELHKALARNPPLEVRRRIEQLLEKQNGADHLRMVRALETLENIGTAEARDLCAALAEGVADAPLTREARATLWRMTR